MNGQVNEVRECPSTDCPFYHFRFGRKEKRGSTLKAIRQKCKDCGEGTAFAVNNCEFPDCPLYQYRFGKNPALKGKRGKGNPEVLKRYRTKMSHRSKERAPV